jgi:hypothetical protein
MNLQVTLQNMRKRQCIANEMIGLFRKEINGLHGEQIDLVEMCKTNKINGYLYFQFIFDVRRLALTLITEKNETAKKIGQAIEDSRIVTDIEEKVIDVSMLCKTENLDRFNELYDEHFRTKLSMFDED